jgi:hypothetical protein
MLYQIRIQDYSFVRCSYFIDNFQWRLKLAEVTLFVESPWGNLEGHYLISALLCLDSRK